jgi:ABC-type bacteriocin/lantibiotic exporter with double-glycine peptidase domain
MIWGQIWELIKRNIFFIVLAAVLVVAAPWTLIFVIPVLIIILLPAILMWRVSSAQRKMYDEAANQAGDHRESQQSHRAWRRRAKNEGEVTIIRTEPTEQRVSDDVGEYVDFKEVKDRK